MMIQVFFLILFAFSVSALSCRLLYKNNLFNCFLKPFRHMCHWCPVLSELHTRIPTSKWQQSLKAWIQLLVAKPQAWAQLCRVGWVNVRERWAAGVFQQPVDVGTVNLRRVRGHTAGLEYKSRCSNWLWEMVQSPSGLPRSCGPPLFAGGVV